MGDDASPDEHGGASGYSSEDRDGVSSPKRRQTSAQEGRVLGVSRARLPHPIPYQGSKRRLASRILSVLGGRGFKTLYEPFAGSAAVTIAASAAPMAERFVISDTLEPLSELWTRILCTPDVLADEYERIWSDQIPDPVGHYAATRASFNRIGGSAELLYLLARCVKNAPRFNGSGDFNQSADHRRRGMNPRKMRSEIAGASALLSRRTEVRTQDFAETIREATSSDLVYLDPPWEGTSKGPDRRYRDWLPRERLIDALEDLDDREVPYILSYDGLHGEKTYGEWLPASVGATRLEIMAGRSSQGTLSGRAVTTVESLYVSRHVTETPVIVEQLALVS
jgi:DNA adenine methylase